MIEKNDLFSNAVRCRNLASQPPVWLMRQAGRYMPEYRAFRSRHSFLEMCHQPEIAAQVTQLPLKSFGMDAAILFSDILVIPEAMRVGLRFEEGQGPIIERPLNNEQDIDHLPQPEVAQDLDYVFKTIKILKPQLKVPLIGFCGAPFTVASYMIEGKSSRELKKTKQWMLAHPHSFHKLLSKITTCTISYLNQQIDAGVDVIQIFDSWANVLAYPQFQEFSLDYLKLIMQGLAHRNIPIILFCRGSSVFAESLAQLKPAALSLDWNCDILQMRQKIPASIALQGNLDPDILYAPCTIIKKEVKRILDGMKGDPGYIFNLGHGIFPDVSVDAVKTLVECVKNG